MDGCHHEGVSPASQPFSFICGVLLVQTAASPNAGQWEPLPAFTKEALKTLETQGKALRIKRKPSVSWENPQPPKADAEGKKKPGGVSCNHVMSEAFNITEII